MATGRLLVSAEIGGKQISKTWDKTGDAAEALPDIPLAGGKAASSWVKTDADTAACNLAPGHGYSTGKMDVYWTSGTTGLERRYDVDVTVTGDALTLDGGSGDDFPETDDTTVIVCTHQQINMAIDGDNVDVIAALAGVRAHIHAEDADGDVIGDIDLYADEVWMWHDKCDFTNPLTGDPVTVLYVSQGTATADTITILRLQDSTP